MITLRRKIAVVTGGSSGIGRGTRKILHGAGARVARVDVQDEKGRALAGMSEEQVRKLFGTA